MHDAVQLEALGVPATCVVTEPFHGLVAQFASTLGMPGYPVTVVPHPISSRDDEHLRVMAARVADSVLAHLSIGPGQG